MGRFQVVGNHTVDGVAPGGTLTVPDEVRARRLVRAGHLAPVRPSCAAETATGRRCSNPAGDGGYCHVHSDGDN